MQVSALDEIRNVGQVLAAMLEATLPDDQDTPAQVLQLHIGPVVSADIAKELLLPERLTCLRSRGVVAAGVPMPEATMHENSQLVARQHQVGGAGKVLAMKSKAVPQGMKVSAQEQLRLGITASDALHHARAGRAVNDVVHANLLTMNILQVLNND